MKTQEQPRTAGLRQRRDANDLPKAALPQGAATGAQPCPERIWWFGVLVGGLLMLLGFLLTLSLVGALLGIPLWAAGLGLMLSPRPCRD
jgi:hypothetical protein